VSLSFDVYGRPAPQGSKRYVGGNRAQGGRFIEASKYLPAWRKEITTAALAIIQDEDWETVADPVSLEVVFYLERPATIPQHKRPWPIKPPDLDKLVRGVCDGLTDAGVWLDDDQVVNVVAWKCYADTREPGATIKITPIVVGEGLDFL
jgi:Holliday junction resolvase RusA-like endonuclease